MPKETVSLTIGAEDRATPVIRDVDQKATELDRLSPDVEVTADDRATGDLRQVRDVAQEVDRLSPQIEATADTDQAEGKLRSLRDAAQGMAGNIGSAVSSLGSLGGAGAVAGVGAVAGFLFDAARDSQTIAFEAQAMAEAFGVSVEEASLLIEAGRKAGLEQADLFDMVNQVSGVLADQPELVRQLGVAADDPIQAFRQVVAGVEDIEDPTQRAVLAQQVFGEEGVRLVAALEAKYGTLETAIAGVDETLVVTAGDVENARAASEKMDRATGVWNAIKRAAGDAALNIADVGARYLETQPVIGRYIGSTDEAAAVTQDLDLNLERAKTAIDNAFAPGMATARAEADKTKGSVDGVTGAIETMNQTTPVLNWDEVQTEADALAALNGLRAALAAGVEVPILVHVPDENLETARRALEELSRPRRFDLTPNVTGTGNQGYNSDFIRSQAARYRERNGQAQ